LVGPNGLLTQPTKRVIETALEAEMTDPLGYEGLNLTTRSLDRWTRQSTMGYEVVASRNAFRHHVRRGRIPTTGLLTRSDPPALMNSVERIDPLQAEVVAESSQVQIPATAGYLQTTQSASVTVMVMGK
jgi:hypothetical protein